MSVNTQRQTIQRYSNEIASLQKKKADELRKANDEGKRSRDAAVSASKASSVSSAQSRLRQADMYAKREADAQKKVADIEKRIAQTQQKLHSAQEALTKEEDREQKKREQKQSRIDQERERQMLGMHRQVQNLNHRQTMAERTIQKLTTPPAKITVLMLAADPIDDPSAVTNPTRLQLDEEARSIQEMIRRSEHRDSIEFQTRWAVRPLDLLNAINESKPTVVHFSGHGTDQDEIVFQGDDGTTKLVAKDAIAATLATVSDSIQLVFFNTCFSSGQADAVVAKVPAAIGMSKAIGDQAACVFSASFYSAIGFGRSLKQAFDQGKAALMLEGIPESDTPELYLSDGLIAEDMVFVSPSGY